MPLPRDFARLCSFRADIDSIAIEGRCISPSVLGAFGLNEQAPRHSKPDGHWIGARKNDAPWRYHDFRLNARRNCASPGGREKQKNKTHCSEHIEFVRWFGRGICLIHHIITCGPDTSACYAYDFECDDMCKRNWVAALKQRPSRVLIAISYDLSKRKMPDEQKNYWRYHIREAPRHSFRINCRHEF